MCKQYAATQIVVDLHYTEDAICGLKTMKPKFLLLLFIGIIDTIAGYQMFQDKIPNGGRVPNPCKVSTYWNGVGHTKAGGGGERNPFGKDFFDNGKKWDKTLCKKDSDGDGKTNGEELGDPDCKWKEGDKNPSPNGISHPGICNPWNSAECQSNNKSKWMKCEDSEFKCNALNDKNIEVKNITFRFKETNVPKQKTTYICQMFNITDVTQDFHLIANQPNIDNQNVMHHMILYGCDNDKSAPPELYSPYVCNMDPGAGCTDMISLWTVGINGDCMHPDAGFRIGKTGYRRLALEMHWNNPDLREDYKDSSGFTIYYTPNLRPNDAGVLIVGQTYLEIPPKRDSVVIEGICASDITKQMITDKVYMMAGLNHMHYLGKSQYVTQYRDGKILNHLTSEPIYSYDSPQLIKYDTTLEFRPGDGIKTVCKYQTQSKSKTTFWGAATAAEMCFGFFFYYPRRNMHWTKCISWRSLPTSKLYSLSEVNGCDLKKFTSSLNLYKIFNLVNPNCKPGLCLDECIPVIQQLRKDPCMQGDVYEYLKQYLFEYTKNTDYIKFRFALESCDAEIDRLERTTTSVSPVPCEETSGSSTMHVMSKILTYMCIVALIAFV